MTAWTCARLPPGHVVDDSREALEDRPLPSKVLIPSVEPGIEKPGDHITFRIEPGDVGTFGQVASAAGQSKVFGRRDAPMLPGPDVVDHVSKIR